MKVLAINPLGCAGIEALADALIDNELSVETNVAVLPHIFGCHHCQALIEQKTRTKRMLRASVRRIVAPRALVGKLTALIRSSV